MSKEVAARRPATADDLAEQYIELSETLKVKGETRSQLATEIKAFGKEFGTARGKRRVVIGKRYAVGIQYRKASPVLNEAGLRAALRSTPMGRDVWVRISRKVVDEKRLSTLLRSTDPEDTEHVALLRAAFKQHITVPPPGESVVVESAKPKATEEEEVEV